MANTLAHSPGDIVRRLIVALGLGSMPSSSAAWPVHTNEPDTPDNVITVYTTSGDSDGREMIGGELQQHYGIQIRIRSSTETVGWVKSDSIRTTLSQISTGYQRTVVAGSSSYLVHAVTRIGDVISLGKEVPESSRNVFTLNCTVVIDPISA